MKAKIIRRRIPSKSLNIDKAEINGLKITPLLKRIFENRNVSDSEELTYPLANLLTPDSFRNNQAATELLRDAVAFQKQILIVGDYDTDGATATALGILCLKSMGAENVDYLVPNRFDYGYGLSPEIAQVALMKKPQLVITVDNGITSIAGVKLLREAGVSVVVTDHHLPGPVLPDANAILNPNQPGCDFPSKVVAGVGVMFYLLVMLRAKLKSEGWFEINSIAVPNMGEYLDLVALGTVADVVPLDYNNRIFVYQGISRIKSGICRPGILALIEVAGKQYRNVTSTDFGFAIAPRLNAAGRLEDISIGIECLITNDTKSARNYAHSLNEINLERREIEKIMQSQAMEIVKKINLERMATENTSGESNKGFCLYDEKWHQGITGLVASRVKEKTDQPVIAFADISDRNISGSARSVPGLHIKDLLESIAIEEPELLIKFGGHAAAAGLTIDKVNLDKFGSLFNSRVVKYYSSVGQTSDIDTDGELSEKEINLDNAELLKIVAPWGQGFPAPVFDGIFDVVEQKVVGETHIKMTLESLELKQRINAIAFRAIEPGQIIPELHRIHAAYQLDINDFRGKRSIQLVIEHFFPITM